MSTKRKPQKAGDLSAKGRVVTCFVVRCLICEPVRYLNRKRFHVGRDACGRWGTRREAQRIASGFFRVIPIVQARP